MRFELIFMMLDIYINSLIPIWTHSQNLAVAVEAKKKRKKKENTEFKDILLRNISCMIMGTVPVNMRIVKSSLIKKDIPFWV